MRPPSGVYLEALCNRLCSTCAIGCGTERCAASKIRSCAASRAAWRPLLLICGLAGLGFALMIPAANAVVASGGTLRVSVSLNNDGVQVTTENYAVKILSREGRRHAVAMALYLVSSGKVRDIEAWLVGILTRADLVQHHEALRCSRELPAYIMFSGGTTGTPLSVYGSEWDLEQTYATYAERWSQTAGPRPLMLSTGSGALSRRSTLLVRVCAVVAGAARAGPPPANGSMPRCWAR